MGWGGGCAGRGAEPPAVEAVAPVVRGARAGLEMHIWVLREPPAGTDGAGPLGEALGPWYEAPGAFSAADRALWAANGLRLVSVPTPRVGEIQAALGTPGAVQRQWLGEHPDWMELARGPQSPRQVVRLDTGLMSLDPGRLRLLGRCWVAPRLGREGAPRAEVRVDLALQHQPPARAPSLRDLVDRPQPRRVEEAGVVFSRFVLELGLSGDEAILIVPERPEVDWSAARAAGTAGAQDGGEGGLQPAGPPAPRLPTLGEAMLWSDGGAAPAGGEGRDRGVRVIIALIPRLPDELELAGAPIAP